VEIEDRITLVAPEGVELHIVLAGVASRFIAISIDILVELALIGVAAIISFAAIGGGLGIALFAIALFVSLYGYYVLFEVLASGRTPGKRMTHLRVVRENGAPVDLRASAVRNLVRLVDILPGTYLVGLACILITRRNQRLGDLAAGTLVTRDVPPAASSSSRAQAVAAPLTWDLSAVTTAELSAARHFLVRRDALEPQARNALAERLAQGIRGKVAGAPANLEAERFLEEVVNAKA